MMDASRAYGAISDGHAGYSVDFGKEVARWFGVAENVPTFTVRPTYRATHHKDWMGPAGTFVSGLDLAYHIAEGLGVKDYEDYNGRGTQARAITAAIRKSRGD